MSKSSKGINTRNTLLKTAKTLFYEQGFTKTTTRQIAEASNVNLGLIKYYFESKAAIALNIYIELRNTFDQFLSSENYSLDEHFLIGSAIEFVICNNSENYYTFFTEIYHEPIIKELFQRKTFPFGHSDATSNELIMRSVAFSYIKPSLIEFSHTEQGKLISLKEYILYYMQQQISAYNLSPLTADSAYNKLSKYYFNVASNFTPVITRINN